MRSARLLVGWDQRVELRTISIARLRRISHSSRSSSDGTNVGGAVGTDTDSAGRNDAGGAERTGLGSVGGNALSGLTNRDRSQASHRNAQYSSLGTIVVLSSSDCINRNSAPHAIQRIALRQPIAAHHTVKWCWSVVGTYGDLTKSCRCSNTALQCLTLSFGATRILETGVTLSSPHYRSVMLGVSDVCACTARAPASALAPAHCSPANCTRSEHPPGRGGRTLHPTDARQQVSRVAVQREAMLGPLAMLASSRHAAATCYR
jgi:hypothetical protein